MKTYRYRQSLTVILTVMLSSVLSVCCGSASNRGTSGVSVKNIPFIEASHGFSGETCVQMVLQSLGHKGTRQWVFDQAGIPVTAGRLCEPDDLSRAVKKCGFAPGPIWSMIKDKRWKKEIKGLWRAMHIDLSRDIPSIVSIGQRISGNSGTQSKKRRFLLVTGYDEKTGQVIFHDPGPGIFTGANRKMDLDEFLALWPVKSSPYTWRVFRLRMAPVKLKPYEPPRDFTRADFAKHFIDLKKKLPGSQFSVVFQKPFFVIGNESGHILDRIWAKGTVQWAIEKLKALYFEKNPGYILDIWLFKDKASYIKYNKQLWGEEPGTPFGYYSSYRKVLVMNIATGGGTLVHEIVHPFMEANFPQCPDWFNEGMGSLYEQAGERNGKIVGLTNWRLKGLQEAISDHRIPTFKEMTHHAKFYSQPYGYAQARYLCYYLQNKNLLVHYYRQFKKSHRSDPTGYDTLKKILGNPDMKSFQKNWETFVLSLRFPPSS